MHTRTHFYHFGLIGYPLGHSLSPKIHAAAFQACGLQGEYSLYPVNPDDTAGLSALIGRMRAGELDGLNVTIPHKQNVLPLLDDLTPSARDIGAVNTIFRREELLVGHNTDAPGFLADMQRRLGIEHGQNGERALVLGSGGAARAVVNALLVDGWHVTLAVRSDDARQAEALINANQRLARDGSPRAILLTADAMRPLLDNTRLVVNTTPVGMFPHADGSPWPEGLPFPSGAALYDVIYNPRETLLVKLARGAGLRADTGLGMLVEQAALAFETWTGQQPPRDVLFAAAEA